MKRSIRSYWVLRVSSHTYSLGPHGGYAEVALILIVLKQTTEGKVAMAAISEPNFANMVVRGCSSRREVWISKEGKRRRDREEREKHGEREIV